MAGKRRMRRRNSKNRTGILVVAGVILIALLAGALVALNSMRVSSSGPAAAAPSASALDKCGSASCGNPNAPVTMDVYADFQCPYCAQFDEVLQQLTGPYIDPGKVKLVYHNFPVIGPESETAAQAAYCAGDQNQFWRFANYMFSQQRSENSGVFTADNLKKMAAASGLDTAAFGACLDSAKYSGAVSRDLTDGRQRGVKATPTFFINRQIHEGGVPYSQLSALLDAALAGK